VPTGLQGQAAVDLELLHLNLEGRGLLLLLLLLRLLVLLRLLLLLQLFKISPARQLRLQGVRGH
jgi:hypothetical protein